MKKLIIINRNEVEISGKEFAFRGVIYELTSAIAFEFMDFVGHEAKDQVCIPEDWMHVLDTVA